MPPRRDAFDRTPDRLTGDVETYERVLAYVLHWSTQCLNMADVNAILQKSLEISAIHLPEPIEAADASVTNERQSKYDHVTKVMAKFEQQIQQKVSTLNQQMLLNGLADGLNRLTAATAAATPAAPVPVAAPGAAP